TGVPVEKRRADPAAYDLALYRRILADVASEARRWGGRVVVLAIPGVEHVVGARGFCEAECVRDPYAESLLAVRHRGIDVARELGLPVIDLHPVQRALPASRMYRLPGSHFSSDGYRVIGRFAGDRLARLELRPRPH